MIAHLSRHARRYLGGAGLTSIIAIVTLGTDLPDWAQAIILGLCVVLHAIWTYSPDWLESRAPDVARAIEKARAEGWDAQLALLLTRVASGAVRREVGADDAAGPDARSPWAAGILALLMALAASCAAPVLSLRADGSGTVEAGLVGAPPLVVHHDAGVTVTWAVDEWPPAVETDDAEACVRVSWLAYEWAAPGCER